MAQDSELVRTFLISCQVRIIFGTDVVSQQRWSLQSSDRRSALHRTLRETCARYWTYLETDDLLEFDGSSARSLCLPHHVLDRIYVENAREWFPGIDRGRSKENFPRRFGVPRPMVHLAVAHELAQRRSIRSYPRR